MPEKVTSNINRNDQWERVRLERDAAQAAGPLAAAVRQSLWKSANTQEVASSKIEVSSSRPVLDTPDPLDQETFEKGKDGLAKFLQRDTSREEFNLDDLVHGTLLSIASNSSQYLKAKRDFFQLERNFDDAKEQERTQEIQKQISSTHTMSSWGKVEKSLTSLGLIAAGIAGIATGGGLVIGLGVAAIVVGTFFALDQLLDDKVKKTVASWIARGDRELEATWLNRIEFFCGLASFALSLGISPTGAVQAAMTVSKAVVGTIKNVLEWKHDAQKAVLMELDAVCTLTKKSVDALFQEIQEICNTLYALHENIHHIEEKRMQLVEHLLPRPAGT